MDKLTTLNRCIHMELLPSVCNWPATKWSGSRKGSTMLNFQVPPPPGRELKEQAHFLPTPPTGLFFWFA